MAATPEGKVKAMVKRGLASLRNTPYVFMPVQSGFGSTTLDFLACIGGRFVAIETKASAAKTLTPRQIATSEFIKLAGGRVFIVYDQATCDDMVAQLALMLEFDNANDQPARRNTILSAHANAIASYGTED